jgi:hypothetical protein
VHPVQLQCFFLGAKIIPPNDESRERDPFTSFQIQDLCLVLCRMKSAREGRNITINSAEII